jgi:hypothetical protein
MKSLCTTSLWQNAALAGEMFCYLSATEIYYRSLHQAYDPPSSGLPLPHLHPTQLQMPTQLPQTTSLNPHFVLVHAVFSALLETFLALYASILQCSYQLSIQKIMSIHRYLQLLSSRQPNYALNGGLSPTRAHSSWETGTGMAVFKSPSQSSKISLTLSEILISIRRMSVKHNGTRSSLSSGIATRTRLRASGWI